MRVDLPIIELAGSSGRLGEAFGESCCAGIRELYGLRLEAALRLARRAGRELTAAPAEGVCRRCLPLTQAQAGPLGVEDLKRLLADHEGGTDRCICRHDAVGVSTNATVILSPATGGIHACRGQPHVGQWVTRKAGGG